MFDTRQQPMYGWQGGQSARSSDMIALPMSPVKRPSGGAGGCNGCMINWHTFGIMLSLLSAATVALGVADVVLTYKTYMEGMGCKQMTTPEFCDPNILVFTWVAVGIWGSLPVFIFGIMSICKGGRQAQQVQYIDLLAFLCAFIFTPAIVALSAIEVYKGVGVYYWTADNLTTDDLVKAIIPIVIGGLGIIEMLMCVIAFSSLCCNQGAMGGGGNMNGGGSYGWSAQQNNAYTQGPYDRSYNTQPIVARQSQSFYAAKPPPPRWNSTYNQFNTGPMNCGGCSANPAYNYFRS